MQVFKITLATLALCAMPAFAFAEEAKPVEQQAAGCPDTTTMKTMKDADLAQLPDRCRDKNNQNTAAEREGDAAPDQGGNNQTGNQEETKSQTNENAGDNNQSGSTVN